ncbi:MAG: RNA methyltransferase [Crocinitomicaceae bacterium]|nr:RNA methyltransferase [Crocinitomicaceae bacterium]MBP6032906.1 RNA methyltransferase [Crocinitomicaceae bacterium]
MEGLKLVSELTIQFPELVHSIYTSADIDPSLLNHFDCYSCNNNEMERISQFNSPSAMIGLFHEPVEKKFNPNERILVLESIQDPGNLGTIIRTADWFGIKQILCSEDTVNCFNSKVIQSSMGSAFRIPVFYENLIEFLPKLNSTIHGALLDGEKLENVNPKEIKILVMGNEGKGISPSLQKHINQAVTIPGYGQAESLNVSIATGIFLHHWSQLKS